MGTALDDLTVARSVPEGTIAVYADLVCPWATIVLERLRRTSHDLGVDVVVDLRPFPLEIVNDGPTPFDVHVAGTRAAAGVEPDYGFTPWPSTEGFPVSSLLGLEAVRAAYAQSATAAVELDAALRRAFFVDHRCISLHGEIIDIAGDCEGVDAVDLDTQLRNGRHRNEVFEHLDRAQEMGVAGSPHVLLADGTDDFLPSLEIDTDDGIRVTEDSLDAIEDLLVRATETRHHD